MSRAGGFQVPGLPQIREKRRAIRLRDLVITQGTSAGVDGAPDSRSGDRRYISAVSESHGLGIRGWGVRSE